MWRPVRLIVVGAFLLSISNPTGAADRKDAPALDDLKWIDRSADRVAELTRAPAECVDRPSNAALATRILLGRLAFRSPVLLGGIAARTGMRCDTCHRNGHGNPAFFIAGVSNEAGTADVTGSIFSRERDDGAFNPVPIPSLVDAASNPPFGSVAPQDDLRVFLRSVIVDEFQGQTPPTAVADGLLAYLSALDSSACPADSYESVGLDRDALELEDAYVAIFWAIERRDKATAEFALLSLRAALGRIHQRFPATTPGAAELIEVSVALTPIRSLIEAQPADAVRDLEQSRAILRGLLDELRDAASRSYYDKKTLEEALARVD